MEVACNSLDKLTKYANQFTLSRPQFIHKGELFSHPIPPTAVVSYLGIGTP